jgi:hypothetical protein
VISMTQWVYGFGDGKADGRAEMRDRKSVV